MICDMTETGPDRIRAMLRGDTVTHVPGIYDPSSAALAVAAGHPVVHLSGAAISAVMLGRPDLGFTPATQIADRAASLAPALGPLPLLADADIGYDSPDHAVWTALAYQRSGISGICLDDVEHAGRSAARIAALVQHVPGVALIARAAGRELDETVRRCLAYAEAGADAVLPVGVEDRDGLTRVREAMGGVPIVVQRSERVTGGNRVSDAELAALGVRLVLHPLTAVLAALRAVSVAYRAIADDGDGDRVDLMPEAAVVDLIPLSGSSPGYRASSAARLSASGSSPGSGRPASRVPAARGPVSGSEPSAEPGPVPGSGSSPDAGGSWRSGSPAAARAGSPSIGPPFSEMAAIDT
jgi:methylisocitrate lyase